MAITIGTTLLALAILWGYTEFAIKKKDKQSS